MDSNHAKAAIDELNGTVMDGQKVKVDVRRPEISGESNHSADGNKIFIYGISASCPSYVLKQKFRQFGRVVENFNSGKGTSPSADTKFEFRSLLSYYSCTYF